MKPNKTKPWRALLVMGVACVWGGYVPLPLGASTAETAYTSHSAIASSHSAQAPVYTGDKLSLNFQNIDVRALLQVLADFTGLNVIASEAVQGQISIRLQDVAWDQALDIILQAKGLGMQRHANVLWIAPQQELQERIKRHYEAQRQLEQLEPLVTQGFPIHYAKAEDIRRYLTEQRGAADNPHRFLSNRGAVIAEPRTNQLFVTETPGKLQAIGHLLRQLDVPVRQVQIEARIVEARESFGRSLGVKFGGGYANPARGAIGSTYAPFGAGIDAPFVNLPASVFSGAAMGSVALSVFNSGLSRFLSLELSAMEAEGVGKIVSSPRLMTADQSQAVIEQGTEYPYTETAPNGATTVTFKKAVLKLEVVPHITPEGDILLSLDINKDSRGEMTHQGVAIDTKHIKTQVLVENGGTVVIGGIFETEESLQAHKVPMLGDIPVLGHLFKSRSTETMKREMLVFITPHMVQDKLTRSARP